MAASVLVRHSVRRLRSNLHPYSIRRRQPVSPAVTLLVGGVRTGGLLLRASTVTQIRGSVTCSGGKQERNRIEPGFTLLRERCARKPRRYSRSVLDTRETDKILFARARKLSLA